ncbi:Dolichyl-phosphate-mannose--protein mannosyltransferase 1 [Elasticomyces elasticus]|nr:Dolichyl-phosphate-mannose--protein mannosyltransferase 1 [Elasticomyces elasticus]KAK3630250.1 Dolichyl-phosphate-mannose--protein mannosyltransferase 1 [Elasticomyces elasticus]KAK4913912.1 Dolichyl-phosphate-mannose--protein mannosyltransferase 1 [Elasticomyces elasticus]KAK5766373.1 Dolichyl-phosphate-mannose--protein mannosyltransferase 1 [Elasticomyces elasticus]
MAPKGPQRQPSQTQPQPATMAPQSPPRQQQTPQLPPTPSTPTTNQQDAIQPSASPSSTDYTSIGIRDNSITNLTSSDYESLGVLTLVALFVRLFRIYQPSSVVFDEVHFGGFASKYIKGKFFMDVHPPLAKMLITLAGYLGGFDGEFDFKDIGKDYVEPNVPYVAMRLLPAIMGVLTIPAMFLTLKAAGCKTTSAILGAGLLIFENGLVTQSRLILLDSPLIIFTALTALSWISFTNLHELGPRYAFTPSWWFWLASTGLTLGATASVKWVGLFTIAWVGSLTALQLWVLLADHATVTPRLWFKHLFARIFCLIVIPVTFYMAMFAIHFTMLVNPGDGDGFMSSEFQSTLNSKGMADVPADIAFGSRVSLRHHNTQGGYLHSHSHMYPTGSKQQQITLYPHKDENNVFLLENQTQPINWAVDESGNTSIPGPLAWDRETPEFIGDGSLVRLYHVVTDRRLHSHDVRPPVTEAEWQNEVSAYGYEGFEGDANDLFRIEIIKSLSDGSAAKSRLRTIQSKFKLVHIMTGCVLFSHKVKLPDWGFEQQEVTCAKGGTLPNSVWYIESNTHPNMNPAVVEKTNYRNPGFFGKFWELQGVMWRTNAGLVESHAWDSRPPSWPVLKRGINFWGKDNRQIYLIGNPLIWWASTLAVGLYLAFKGLAVLRWQRGCGDYGRSVVWRRFDYEIGGTVLGWGFHYFPFFLMQRQLFLHHYFPALYFAILAVAQIFDFATARIVLPGQWTLKDRPFIGRTGAVVFLAASIVVFGLYAPLTYGNTWTKSECARVKLMDTWDWDCNTFLDSYADYSLAVPSASGPKPTGAVAGPAPPVAEDPKMDVVVTPGGQVQQPMGDVVSGGLTEEKIEYRDENGNLLDEEQVKALEGKVSFSTRYETRTRLVDAQGNEVGYEGEGEAQGNEDAGGYGEGAGVAGTMAEGPEPVTEGGESGEASKSPPGNVDVAEDVRKEEWVEGVKATAEPEAEGVAATHGEL